MRIYDREILHINTGQVAFSVLIQLSISTDQYSKCRQHDCCYTVNRQKENKQTHTTEADQNPASAFTFCDPQYPVGGCWVLLNVLLTAERRPAFSTHYTELGLTAARRLRMSTSTQTTGPILSAGVNQVAVNQEQMIRLAAELSKIRIRRIQRVLNQTTHAVRTHTQRDVHSQDGLTSLRRAGGRAGGPASWVARPPDQRPRSGR